jgi:hypothetical protein
MIPEIKAEWTAALRSGEYAKGTHVLRNLRDEYCCLGVLCEIAIKHDVIPPACQLDGVYSYGAGEQANQALLPVAVAEWAGFGTDTSPDAGYFADGSPKSLTYLNDVTYTSFGPIADLIDEYL